MEKNEGEAVHRNGEPNSMEAVTEASSSPTHGPKGNGTAMEMNGNAVSTQDHKINYRGWKVMPFIIGNETFEKLGAIGTLANLLIYLTSVFNLSSITAANIINIFNGTTNLATLLGAFLCDTYFGRYKTLAFCTIASYLGLQAIQLTAAIKNLHPPDCGDNATCDGPTAGQMAFLVTGFAMLTVGAAGIRPCNLAFGADQFNPNTESGRTGITSFFNWYFFTFTFAQMVSLTLIVYIQSNVSWAIGLLIPALLMLISCAVYFMGWKMYVKVKATGSPMTSIVQVLVVSIKKSRLSHPKQPWLSLYNYISPKSINSKLPYTDQLRCLDKAAILTPEDRLNPDGSPADPWRLCSMQQVEEAKCVAAQSDRQLGSTNFKIPSASYVVFVMISLTLFIPLYDQVLVPFLRRVTGKEGGITLLQRMGIGMFIAMITMILSGVMEERRRTIALTKPTMGTDPRRGDISSMSAMWLIPQFVSTGLAEAFTSIGQIEFYYKQFPENMRSIGGSLFYCGMAGSSYLSSLLISVVHNTTKGSERGDWLPQDLNKGRLDYFYYVIAGLGFLNLIYFMLCARWYKYKEKDEICPLPETEMQPAEKAVV
ncbi:hypothetical protein CRG98_001646 [Punica granatum]|uniref:Protein NRT1/ PTR FAMILY 2.11-like n=1 Tax=Punica granatum TaxID=22663 RepID=A0A2I0LCU0_PUNGR|nr:hypothetical protein CRG98_001646 [Punica granatum]